MENNLSFKLQLCYDLAKKYALDLKDKSLDLISNYEEILKVLKSGQAENCIFLYSNKNLINKILFDANEIISFNVFKKNKTLKDYYNLSLLLFDAYLIVNYEYPKEYIYEILDFSKQIKKEDKLKKIIISKIVIEFINYYKELDEYDRKKDGEELEKIKNENIQIIKDNMVEFNDLKLKVEDILSKKIDDIYLSIIISLIKNEKLCNYRYAYNIISQLDLESININNKMFEELSKILKTNKIYTHKHIIKQLDDLFDISKINFYYILIKYILKNSIYFYQTDLLSKAKKILKTIIKSRKNKALFPKYKNKNEEKIEYVVKTICDSEYYLNLYINNLNNVEENKSKNTINEDNNYNSNKDIIDNSTNDEPNEVINSIEEEESTNIKDNLDKISSQVKYEVSKPIKILESHKKQANFIIELSNGMLISVGEKNELKFYDKNYNIIKKRKISYYIYSIKDMSNFVNIEKNSHYLFFCTNEGIKVVEIKNNNINSLEKYGIKIKNVSMYFYSNSTSIVCTRKGIIDDYGTFFNGNNSNSPKYITIKTFMAGVQINERIFAFTSNNVDINGEDKIIFYDSYSKRILFEIKEYSFILSTNGLCSITINESNSTYNYILLCACKKYFLNQKNGILLINIEMNERSIEISRSFYDTRNFEVYCFCPIFSKKKSERIIKNDSSFVNNEYFLVGGYQKDKGKGVIRLYRIKKKLNFLETGIEFIQDIKFENNGIFKTFKEPISCIIQSKINGNLAISCWDGNTYIFSIPKIDHHLFNNKKINKKILN